jgi:hypothetical protein
MTRIALTLAAATAGLLAPSATGVAGNAASAHALATCGQATVGGATVVTYCGPAKVTFKFGGKTYFISGGSCSVSAGFWTLLAGRQTLPRATSKFTSFQAAFVGRPKARTYTKAEFTLSFQIPGADWVLALGLPHNVTVTAGGKKGTFTGAFYIGNKTGTRPASGTWTC